MRIVGIDISLNHVGIVSLDSETGQVFDWFYVTDKKKHYTDKDHCSWLHFSKTIKADKDTYNAYRAEFMMMAIHRFLQYQNIKSTETYVALENYAYGSVSRSVYQIGELGGVIRHLIFCSYRKMRYYDPTSVKKFATSNGHAFKKDMVQAALDNGFSILDDEKLWVNTTKIVKRLGVKEKVPELGGPVTDLADAYFLARMLETELNLRAGTVLLENLPEHKRDLFLRVTKSNPVNILAMPFIHKEIIK